MVDSRDSGSVLLPVSERLRASGPQRGEPAQQIPESDAAARAQPVPATAIPRIAGVALGTQGRYLRRAQLSVRSGQRHAQRPDSGPGQLVRRADPAPEHQVLPCIDERKWYGPRGEHRQENRGIAFLVLPRAIQLSPGSEQPGLSSRGALRRHGSAEHERLPYRAGGDTRGR